MRGSTGRRRRLTGRTSLASTAEQRVVLEIAKVDRARDDAHLEELLRGGVDWGRLRETAARHRMVPLLHARLKGSGGGAVPAGEAAAIGALYAENARRNLLATATLLKVLRRLEAFGVPAIPLKGPALAEAACGDITMRQFTDLDILVRERDVPAVQESLASQGFEPTHGFTGRQESAHLRRTCELSYARPDKGVFLDIHWRFAADYLAKALDAGRAFDRHLEGRLQGHAIRALRPDDLLLFLCLHGAFHLYDTLWPVSDVARLVESRDDWDWRSLRTRAREARVERMLLLGLLLARELLGARVPDRIADAAANDRAVMTLSAEVRRELFREPPREPGFRETARFQLRARDGLADRLSYCAIRAFSPTVRDWELVSLPDRFYFLYYVLRPLRLAGLGNAFRARSTANG